MKENIETIGIEVIKNYIKAFNERNSDKMADLFNFPHVRFANDSVSVISKSEYLNNQDKTHDYENYIHSNSSCICLM